MNTGDEQDGENEVASTKTSKKDNLDDQMDFITTPEAEERWKQVFEVLDEAGRAARTPRKRPEYRQPTLWE